MLNAPLHAADPRPAPRLLSGRSRFFVPCPGAQRSVP